MVYFEFVGSRSWQKDDGSGGVERVYDVYHDNDDGTYTKQAARHVVRQTWGKPEYKFSGFVPANSLTPSQ